MDVASLLYAYRPTRDGDVRRKALAMRAGHAIARELGNNISAADFFSRAREAAANRFGGAAQDSYITTTLSVVASYQPHLDLFLGAALNSIVLSLGFQTRLAVDGLMREPEVVLFEGSQDYFTVAMLHGNVVMGIHITDLPDDASWFPAWAADHAALEINKAATFRTDRGQVADRMRRHGRTRVGALLLVDPLPEWGELAYAQRYSEFAEFVSRHTIYAFAASAELTLVAARSVQASYPDAVLHVRLYSRQLGVGVEHRGILVFSGIEELPRVTFASSVEKPLRFLESMPNDGTIHPDVEVLSYTGANGDLVERRLTPAGENKVVGKWEPAIVKRPLTISSSAPIPEEGRRRISDTINIFHSAGVLDGGMLIPSQDHMSSVYVCADKLGNIVMEFGDEYRSLWNSPIWRNGIVDDQGVRQTRLTANRIVRVKGSAMPLFLRLCCILGTLIF